MASMAAKGIVLPTNPMTAMAMGFGGPVQRDELHGDEAVPVSCPTCFRIRWLVMGRPMPKNSE